MMFFRKDNFGVKDYKSLVVDIYLGEMCFLSIERFVFFLLDLGEMCVVFFFSF